MKLKFATGHVSLRVDLAEMQSLVKEGNISETIALSGGQISVVITLVEEEIAAMQFDPNTATIGFVFPRPAVETELAKPTRNGIGGYFEQGVFSLAVDMHDIRKKAKGK